MAKPPKHAQFTAEVAQAELIPADRPLTAEEIERLDALATRLRLKFSTTGSPQLRILLRRVTAVRNGTRRPTPPNPASAAKMKKKAKTEETEPSHAEQKAATQSHSLQLLRIAQAGRPMTPSDAQTLDRLIAELETLSRTVPLARTLWTQALDTRAHLTGGSDTPDRDRSGVPSAGRISAPRGLDMGWREVSGGAPGTRRGH
ncbi:Uncharacterised protein [Mycobacteroides abscessus subsp. abscessus]|uniref:hypothetical protein n=1 Tax=Mycobacteroides abscessus TaxID=36809 RepID=UPI00092692F2|nr:hypothetical protein [Mycobacteroides abscessus]SIF61281.1 Uncharacterised protein [Mycobacteroides abscessus subsp. abscessus]